MDGGHRVGVGGQRLEAFPRTDIPNADALVKGPGHHQVGLRIEVAAERVVGVTFQRFHALPGAQLPDLEGFVVGGAHDKSKTTTTTTTTSTTVSSDPNAKLTTTIL